DQRERGPARRLGLHPGPAVRGGRRLRARWPRRPGPPARSPARPADATGGHLMTGPLLEVRGLVVEFGGFRALDGVDLTVEAGELRFLIGPNGAGKTTLIDVVSGLTRRTAGEVTFRGRPIAGRREHELVRLGI